MDPSASGEMDLRAVDYQTHHSSNFRSDEKTSAEAETAKPKAPKEDQGWRWLVRNFTASWFSVTMGTGMVSILLNILPYQAAWLYWLSVVFYCLNVLLFSVILFVYICRNVLYPEILPIMIRDPVISLFLATIPIGFATLIDMFVLICVPAWGDWAKQMAWGMWWIDVVLGVMSCFCLPFVIMSVHKTRLSGMTAAWLLPISPCIVGAATGAGVARVLVNQDHALWTLTTSFALWGIGAPFAFIVLALYFHRLAVHKLPPREVIVSCFLPLSPLGMGSYAIVTLGLAAKEILVKGGMISAATGEVLYILGLVMGLAMWSFGLVWLFFALASISRSKFPFNMGWWGFVFPLAVYAMATITLGKELDSKFFKILATIFSILVFILWAGVMGATVVFSLRGDMFYSPCLEVLKNKTPKPSRSVE